MCFLQYNCACLSFSKHGCIYLQLQCFSAERIFSKASHHVEIKVITQSHCVVWFTHFLHHILDYQTDTTDLSQPSVSISNLVYFKVYENSKFPFFKKKVPRAHLWKLLLTKQTVADKCCFSVIEAQQKMEKSKRQLKVVFPRNESVLIILSSPNGLKGEQQVPKSVAVPEVNRTAAKFNGAKLARSTFIFRLSKAWVCCWDCSLVYQGRNTQQKYSTIQINGQWSCIKASFLSWLIYETFYGIFFLQSAVCIYNTALLPLRNRTLLHLSFNWNQSSKILFIPERASYHFVHMLKYGLYMLCPWWLDDSMMLRQNLIFKANIRDDREGATHALGHL